MSALSLALRRLSPPRLGRAAERFAKRVRRRLAGVNERVVTLKPEGESRGRVLFSYIVDPFLLKPGEPLPHSHTHYWESRCMATTFLESGFTVDVLHWTNRTFAPRERYDFYVDVRRNFARTAPRLNKECVKILHLDTAHHAFHNAAQLRRLAELKRRRGIDLPPFKLIEETRAIEVADCATVLGNDFTIGTYRFAGKPLHRIPVSVPFTYDFPAAKDWEACRTSFLWFGSEGFVHKGLDLVLEAFAGMPELRLFVVGPIEREPRFEAAFARELYATPNIRTLGWVDAGGASFAKVAGACVAVIYPSCSEGGGAGVLTCMHAGLVPIVSTETSVDVPSGAGIILRDGSVDTIRAEVRRTAGLPPEQVRAMAEAAWRFAREHHTRERFAEAYRRFVDDLLAKRIATTR
jgi:glycosyltransferase involved in cell wall biosynthesis